MWFPRNADTVPLSNCFSDHIDAALAENSKVKCVVVGNDDRFFPTLTGYLESRGYSARGSGQEDQDDARSFWVEQADLVHFEMDDRCKILLGTIDMLGEGLNLQRCDYMFIVNVP